MKSDDVEAHELKNLRPELAAVASEFGKITTDFMNSHPEITGNEWLGLITSLQTMVLWPVVEDQDDLDAVVMMESMRLRAGLTATVKQFSNSSKTVQ